MEAASALANHMQATQRRQSTLNIAIRSPNQHVTVSSLCGAVWAFVVNPTLV